MRLRLTDVIDRDYTGVIKKKMEGVYAVQGGGGGGGDRGEKDRREREQKGAYIVGRPGFGISGS